MRLYILFTFTLFAFFLYSQPTVSFAPVISTGLTNPLSVVNAGDGSNRLFVLQKGGKIKVYDQSYASLGTFLTVTDIDTTASEEGLLSMVFHPEYYNNGYFWVYYTNTDSNLEIARYKVSSGDSNVADATSKQVVLTIPHLNQTNHNGGELHFGSDGYLYLSTGDGGGGGDPGNNSQNTSSLLGKILRLNVSTGTTPPFYTNPADNPFGNQVYVLGLRNPFRWEFDRHAKDMWIGDVGQDAFEEIDYLPANAISGKNLGWRCYEANNPYNTSGCSGTYTYPVHNYPLGASRSVMGGTVYRGYEYPALKGFYVGADYFSGNVFKIKFDSLLNQWITTTQNGTLSRITDFGESESGELFITRNKTSNPTNYAVYKITSTGVNPTTYVFTGNGDWTSATNWRGNSIPPNPLPSGSQIVIKPRKNGLCNLNQIQVINEGADIFIEPGSIFDINSNLTILE